MKKRIKMAIYGDPGVGKSTFAIKSEKPFFITSDGNYSWLEEFGAKAEDHVEVSSWAEAKKVFQRSFDEYETIVIDLTEDLFKWCEYEYCAKNKFEHISDVGYGKGYDITRNEFFMEMSKLISLDKNIIFIMHGQTVVVKDRRGVEHTYYRPTSRMPEKVVDMLEGRVRYFLRCYLKAEELSDGTILKKRYLSLIPKENEFGIHRGADETKMPEDIPLDFNEFLKAIGMDSDMPSINSTPVASFDTSVKEIINEEHKEESKVRRRRRTSDEIKEETQQQDVQDVQEVKEEQDEIHEVQEEVKEEVKQPEKQEEPKAKELTQAERIAAIKAALAAKRQ